MLETSLRRIALPALRRVSVGESEAAAIVILLQVSSFWDAEGKSVRIRSFSYKGQEYRLDGFDLREFDCVDQGAIYGETSNTVRIVTHLLNMAKDHTDSISLESEPLLLNALVDACELFDPSSRNVGSEIRRMHVSGLSSCDGEYTLDVTTNPPKLLDLLRQLVGKVYEIRDGAAMLVDPKRLRVKIGSEARAITPFTYGSCRQRCVFCYVNHVRFGPRYPKRWNRSLSEIEYALSHYDPNTGLGLPPPRQAFMDWEPLDHPDFLRILDLLASRESSDPIQIVTSGNKLTANFLKEVARRKLGSSFVFQVSLNSANVDMRTRLMPGATADDHWTAIGSIELMHELGINFDVSLLALPGIVGWADIFQTIHFVDRYEPYSFIRVALPTATRNHRPEINVRQEELVNYYNTLDRLRHEVESPIAISVAQTGKGCLSPIVVGVERASVLRIGDLITHVDDEPVLTGSHANRLLSRAWNGNQQATVNVRIQRQGNPHEFRLKRRTLGAKRVGLSEFFSWGVVVENDIDPEIIYRIQSIRESRRYKRIVVATGELMGEYFSRLRDQGLVSMNGIDVVSVRNSFFGGNVTIAGLLTLDDIIRTLDSYGDFDSVFVPRGMLSSAGYDLKGKHVSVLQAALDTPVEVA